MAQCDLGQLGSCGHTALEEAWGLSRHHTAPVGAQVTGVCAPAEARAWGPRSSPGSGAQPASQRWLLLPPCARGWWPGCVDPCPSEGRVPAGRGVWVASALKVLSTLDIQRWPLGKCLCEAGSVRGTDGWVGLGPKATEEAGRRSPLSPAGASPAPALPSSTLREPAAALDSRLHGSAGPSCVHRAGAGGQSWRPHGPHVLWGGEEGCGVPGHSAPSLLGTCRQGTTSRAEWAAEAWSSLPGAAPALSGCRGSGKASSQQPGEGAGGAGKALSKGLCRVRHHH